MRINSWNKKHHPVEIQNTCLFNNNDIMLFRNRVEVDLGVKFFLAEFC